jgi:DNA-binding CsgD family transcriptional regulator/PAS domain-containing protein
MSFDEGAFLDLLYGAAVQPELWPMALEKLTDALGADSALLSRANIATGEGTGIAVRMNPAVQADYDEYWSGKNVLNNAADPQRYIRDWRPTVLTDEDWMPKEELTGGEYYNDFLKTLEIHSVLFIRLALHDFDACVFNVHRRTGKGQFGAAEREFVGRIHRHLIRAFELSERLAGAATVGAGLESIFDASPQGIFLVDRNCRILRVNPAGERIVGAAKGLFACGGRLSAAAPEANKRLRGLVAMAACADREFRGGGSMALPSPAGGLPLSIMAAPVQAQALPLFAVGPCALVCVTDLERGRVPTAEGLRDLFGLTTAEARVALALSEGLSPAETAERLKVSSNTVRVHLARIFDKTGTRRQSELARLMTRTVGLELT